MPFNRRQMLAGIGATGLASSCVTLPKAELLRAVPNILWLVSEDNNPFIGAYGDPIANTPNIDAMARDGILYRNIFSNAPVCAPSRFCLLTGIHPETSAPANHMRAEASLPDFIQTYPEYLRVAGYYCTNNEKTDYNCKVEPDTIWNESSPQAHYRNRPEGTPFMAVFNSMTTHESRLFGVTEGKVQPADVRVPAYLPDSEAVRRDFASYYNLMERMDGFVGQHLRELEEAGLADETIVFYYSDNGGCMPRSKRYCYDEGLRCAMVVHVPEKWRHLSPVSMGSEVAAPVSFIDFVPTLLSIAGLDQPSELPGKPFLGSRISDPKQYAFGMRNRMDERYDFIRTVSDGRYRYIRNYMPHRPLGQVNAFPWMLKSYQDWHMRYLAGDLPPVQSAFFEPRTFEELYDLEADPDEVHNLAGDAAQAARITRMRAALDAHMQSINDNGFIPEGSPLEGYLASRVPGAYPLAEIMALAADAADRDRDTLVALQGALAHDNEVMRYWAATGLLVRKGAAMPAKSDLVSALQRETSAQVRIVMAEALTHLGQQDLALGVLDDLVRNAASDAVRLQAINALTYISNPSPAMDAVSEWQDKGEYVGRAATYLVRLHSGHFDPSVPLLPPRGGPAG